MGWKKVSNDSQGVEDGVEFVAWDDPKHVDGTWIGTFTSTNKGTLMGKMRQMDGKLYQFTVPTVLESLLEEVRMEAMIRIEYEGLVMGKKGREYKSFQVYEDDGQ